MYADSADYCEWKTVRHATGLIYSASIMSNKMGWAVGASIVGLLLVVSRDIRFLVVRGVAVFIGYFMEQQIG
jgi:Na+/melibiose symporter-like transporter